jgi:hypothetical protein
MPEVGTRPKYAASVDWNNKLVLPQGMRFSVFNSV